MDFGDIISKNLNLLDKDDYDKLKEMFQSNNSEVKYTYKNLSNFINNLSESDYIKSLIIKILKSPKDYYNIQNCKEFINNFNEYDFLSLDILKKFTFSNYGDLYSFDEFIKEYQLCCENFEPFMNKLFNLGYKFTEELFNYYCDNGLDKIYE